MIVVDLPEPKNCLECPVRMECKEYRVWLMDASVLSMPKISKKKCLIKEAK